MVRLNPARKSVKTSKKGRRSNRQANKVVVWYDEIGIQWRNQLKRLQNSLEVLTIGTWEKRNNSLRRYTRNSDISGLC